MLTQERLKHLLDYDKNTGLFTRKVRTVNSVRVGDIAGGINQLGYRAISIDNKIYLAHRLVWLYMYGVFPEKDTDHINMDRADNRLCNLRTATRSQNMRNTGLRANNTTGVKGVSIYRGKFKAQINDGAKVIVIGVFDTIGSAKMAYESVAKDIGGEYYRATT
jgi:hypothetical protein